MTMNLHAKRWVAGLTLVTLAVTMLAPVAQAGHRERRYRGRSDYSCAVYRPAYRVVHVHRSSDGDAFVGFLGGLVLGAVLTSAAQAHADAPPRYYYYDPYCDERFDSLESCRAHFRAHYHTRVVRVIDSRSGDCVETMRYQDGCWHQWDDDGYDD